MKLVLLMKRLENLKKSFIFLREIKRKLLKQKNLTKEIKELSKKLIELQKVFKEEKIKNNLINLNLKLKKVWNFQMNKSKQ